MAGPKAALRRYFAGKFLIALCGLALALVVVHELAIGISPARAEDTPASPAPAEAAAHLSPPHEPHSAA